MHIFLYKSGLAAGFSLLKLEYVLVFMDSNIMNESFSWSSSRGLERILLQETVVSDLLQFLSDLDPTPWTAIVGFTPLQVTRESLTENRADLLLEGDGQEAIIEVKVGHLFNPVQQKMYEALDGDFDLYLAALRMDEQRVTNNMSAHWRFLSLTSIFHAWCHSVDATAKLFAQEISAVFQAWDNQIQAVFQPQGAQPISSIRQKALARVASRRMGADLQERGRLAYAGVSSGGGVPLVQAWTPVRGEDDDRCFMAEVRWRQNHPVGELRFGIDFDSRPGQQEDEEVRRAAYELAISMEEELEAAALQEYLCSVRPSLSKAIQPTRRSRPDAKGDWEQIIQHGFANLPKVKNRKPNRRQIRPAFYGDGALRFQAMGTLDFTQLNALKIVELIDASLAYLVERQPAGA